MNPCGDPHTGASPTPPNAEGGALRSQDVRTMDSLITDPVGLDGTMIRVDASTGEGMSTNPMFDSPDPNARRIIAAGLRNPFRFDLAENGELWIGDVGWGQWEEINRLPDTGVPNFGWPCREGPARRQPAYDAANLAICETLYSQPAAATEPFFAYKHLFPVVDGESCPTGTSSIAGVRIYDGADATSFPGVWENALFFADYSRDCIWAMRAGADGIPDPSTVQTFDAGASNPVWLEVGPDGALYYADFDRGRVMRIQSTAANQSPAAALSANPTAGSAPLEVEFDGTASSDADNDSLAYAWDLDGDGELDDSSSPAPTHTYTAGGSYNVKLRVSDGRGGSDTATTTIDVDNTPPVPTIDAPLPDLRWKVGDEIDFSGSAQDVEDGTLPESALRWRLAIRHCPSTCHTHTIQSFAGHRRGDAGRSRPRVALLPAAAPHGHRLRRRRASTAIQLVPRTSVLKIGSAPPGAQVALDATSGTAPLRQRVIVGSQHTISAPTPQLFGGEEFDFLNWSDGGAATHTVTAGAANETVRWRGFAESARRFGARCTRPPRRRDLRGSSGTTPRGGPVRRHSGSTASPATSVPGHGLPVVHPGSADASIPFRESIATRSPPILSATAPSWRPSGPAPPKPASRAPFEKTRRRSRPWPYVPVRGQITAWRARACSGRNGH